MPSALVPEGAGGRLFLATSSAPSGSPLFFRGTLRAPRRTADLLLALSQVVRSRFHSPASMLARILAEADPVVTCSVDRLRFEGFSSCCGVYARVDLQPEALDGVLLGHGTTNVDFNPPIRAALTKLRDTEPVRLSVGAAEIELTTPTGHVVERKVPLPLRWLKGFVEAQAHQARMSRRFDLSAAETRRFVRSIPRSDAASRLAWVSPLGAGVRLSQTESRGSVRVAGPGRLRVLDDLVRHALGMRIYADDRTGSSAWELILPHERFHLVLSPEVWRGFSGEGQVLSELSDQDGKDAAALLRPLLRWESAIDVDALARQSGFAVRLVRLGLAWLGASGIVGYDLGQAGYFHRELPYDCRRLEALNPRLASARKLVDGGAVRVERRSAEGVEAWVRGSGVDHRVKLSPTSEVCTCPWWGKHAGDRGPCRHVLAVNIFLEEMVG